MSKSRNKKPIFKKWWFWVVIVVLIGSIASGGSKGKKETEPPQETTTVTRSSSSDAAELPHETVALKVIDNTPAPAAEVDQAVKSMIASESAPEAAPETTNVTVAVHGAGRNIALPSGTYVWISATGSKFHSKNDCGNMNPEKAQMIMIDEAQRRGIEACEKCF